MYILFKPDDTHEFFEKMPPATDCGEYDKLFFPHDGTWHLNMGGLTWEDKAYWRRVPSIAISKLLRTAALLVM